jgi:ATP synthase A chain
VETDAAFGAIVFCSTIFYGIRALGLSGYLATFTKPTWVMIPLNIVEQITRTFPLIIRLFGNILSGVFIGAIVLSLAGLFVPIPFMALDLLTGAIQATTSAASASLQRTVNSGNTSVIWKVRAMPRHTRRRNCSTVRDFWDEEEVRRVYYPEAERRSATTTPRSAIMSSFPGTSRPSIPTAIPVNSPAARAANVPIAAALLGNQALRQSDNSRRAPRTKRVPLPARLVGLEFLRPYRAHFCFEVIERVADDSFAACDGNIAA